MPAETKCIQRSEAPECLRMMSPNAGRTDAVRENEDIGVARLRGHLLVRADNGTIAGQETHSENC